MRQPTTPPQASYKIFFSFGATSYPSCLYIYIYIWHGFCLMLVLFFLSFFPQTSNCWFNRNDKCITSKPLTFKTASKLVHFLVHLHVRLLHDDSRSRNGESRPLITDEPDEFQKQPVEVQDFRKISDCFRGTQKNISHFFLFDNIKKLDHHM